MGRCWMVSCKIGLKRFNGWSKGRAIGKEASDLLVSEPSVSFQIEFQSFDSREAAAIVPKTALASLEAM